MLKLIGALLLFFACSSLGFHIARTYRERLRQLQYLTHTVRLLQTEIEYGVTPLPQAFEKVSIHAKPPCDILFSVAAARLSGGESSAAEAIQAGLEQMKPKSFLKVADVAIISEFSKVLGMADRAHLTKQFHATLHLLEEVDGEAREAQNKNERMWQYLGVLGGLLMIILLY